jgi:hypothetical protein
MTQQTNIAEEIGMLWDYTVNRGLTFLANSSQVPTLRALLEGEKLEDQPTFEWLKEDSKENHEESREVTFDALTNEVKQLRAENKELRTANQKRLNLFKATLEDHKLGGYLLDQSYIDGVDETIDWAIAEAEETFGENYDHE